jgi:hypothetical protein
MAHSIAARAQAMTPVVAAGRGVGVPVPRETTASTRAPGQRIAASARPTRTGLFAMIAPSTKCEPPIAAGA